jgi:reductive dehalogenase
MNRVDERDIMFSRMERKKGTPEYEDYYKRRKDLKDIDDELRAMPEMDSEDTAMFNKLNTPLVSATFNFLSDIKGLVEGPEKNPDKIEAKPEIFTKKVKGIASYYGSVLTGITKCDESYYYSHRGRDDSNYGEKVNPKHTNTIVFAVEMDKDSIFAAPQLIESIEVTKAYLDAAVIGMMLTYYIKKLGYSARNHMDGNYEMMLALAAKKAGLGDIGRHGMLITEKYGSRVRLGAVTTDMPLVTEKESDFKVNDFCEICKKCISTCPAKAIQEEKELDINGIKRWQINREECYKKWRILGTDCGICIATCPFSSDIREELIEEYKIDSQIAEKIIKEHEEKYKIRPFSKEKPEWMKDS